MGKAKAGDPLAISASTWNKVQDLVQTSVDANSSNSKANQPFLWMWAKNESGGAFARGSVAKISGVIADEATNPKQFLYAPSIKIDDAVATEEDIAVIMLEPIADTKTGRVAIEGVCIASVDCTAAGRYAKIVAGALVAGLAPSCIVIKYRPAGTGVKNCLVSLCPTGSGKHYIAYTTGATARSGTTLGTGTATIQTISASNVLSNTSQVVDFVWLSTSALGAGYIIISQEDETGKYTCIWDDCA